MPSRSVWVYSSCGWKVNHFVGMLGDKGQAAMVERRGSLMRWRRVHRSKEGMLAVCVTTGMGFLVSWSVVVSPGVDRVKAAICGDISVSLACWEMV